MKMRVSLLRQEYLRHLSWFSVTWYRRKGKKKTTFRPFSSLFSAFRISKESVGASQIDTVFSGRGRVVEDEFKKWTLCRFSSLRCDSQHILELFVMAFVWIIEQNQETLLSGGKPACAFIVFTFCECTITRCNMRMGWRSCGELRW